MGNLLFGSSDASNQPNTMADPYMRAQSSVDGKPIPIGYGATRIASNLIWVPSTVFGVYTITTYAPSSPGGGGKGSVFGGGSGSNATPQTSYTYSSPVIFALSEGPVSDVLQVWYNKSKVPFSTAQQPGNYQGVDGQFDMALSRGAYDQNVLIDGFNHRGIATLTSNPMFLGGSTDFPNFTFLTVFTIAAKLPTLSYGANPPDVITDFLTNPHYGVGVPAELIDTMTLYSSYCLANGFMISPLVTEQRAASDFLLEWTTGTNSEFVSRQGLLTVVPYGDQNLSGNGSDYTAPGFAGDSVGTYHISDADYVLGKGGGSVPDSPVVVTRKRLEDSDNTIQISYLDGENGANSYNPATVDAKNDALINIYGNKTKPQVNLNMFTEKAAALQAAQLLLGRELVLNTYEFTVTSKYILLDPMDLIEITDNILGIQNLPVRIKEIKENDDYSLTILAEDYLQGAANSPAYSVQGKFGAIPNYNISAGSTQPPLFFEPTDQLAGGLFVWMAVTGVDLTSWGGCDVWVSSDGVSYQKQGRIVGPARMGTVTNSVSAIATAVQGATLDNSNTLAVDTSISGGQLSSITQTDLLKFANLIYFDGEFLSFRDATPTGTNTYTLAALNRGAYGTDPLAHSAGKQFCRIDNGIFALPFTADRIGSPIYVKLLSFNQFGGGGQSLADVGAYQYTIQGTALYSPLPNVQNFVSSYVGNILYFDWDPVSDFRVLDYEIRKGVSWDTGIFVGLFAHPHIPAIGDDDYWIKAVAEPVAGRKVYSDTATELNVTGSILGINLIASYDEGPAGANWPLTGQVTAANAWLAGDTSIILTAAVPAFVVVGMQVYDSTNGQQIGTVTGKSGSTLFISSAISGGAVHDLLSISSTAVLNGDVYNDGTFIHTKQNVGSTGTGYFTIPSSHIINNGRRAPVLIHITFAVVGEGSADFFNPGPPDNSDFFAHSDVFDTASNEFVEGHPEIQLSTDGVNFGPWQRYKPGFYNAWKINARMQLTSSDPNNVGAVLTAFTFTVYAQTRVDHPLVSAPVAAIGRTITFAPDGAAATPFISGPNGGTVSPSPGVILASPSLPATQALLIDNPANPLSPGDQVVVSNLTLSGCFVQAVNSAGNGIPRRITLQVWGF